MSNGLTREEKIHAILQAQSKKDEPSQEVPALTREEKIQAILENQQEANKQEILRGLTAFSLAPTEGLVPFIPTELASYGSALVKKGIEKQLEGEFEEKLRQKGITEEFPVSNPPTFADYVNQSRREFKSAREEFPSAMALELAYGLAYPTGKLKQAAETFGKLGLKGFVPKVVAKGAEKVSKGFDIASGIGQKIPGLQTVELAADAGKLAKIGEYGKAVTRMAAGGAAAGIGAAGIKTATDLAETATGGRELPTLGELGEQAGTFALGGAAVGAAIPHVVSAANQGLKYVIPVVLGPGKPEAVERFITTGRERRQKGELKETGPGSLAMTSIDVKDLIDPVIQKIGADIEAGKAALEDLKRSEKDALDRLKTAQANAKGDALERLKIQDQRIREQVKIQTDLIEFKLGENYAKKVAAAAGDLKTQLETESAKSYDILQDARAQGLKIDLSDVPSVIDKQLDTLKIGKTELQNQEAKRARAVLTLIRDKWKNLYRKGIRPITVKTLLKDEIDKFLNQVVEGGKNSAEWSPVAFNLLMNVRRHIDSKIKSFEPYKKQMELVYSLQNLRKTISSDILGDNDLKILTNLRKITDKGNDSYKLLSELQKKTGIDLIPDLDLFLANKNVTPQEFQKIKANIQADLEKKSADYLTDFERVEEFKKLERLPEADYQAAIEKRNVEEAKNLAAIRAAKAAKEKEVLELQKQLNSIGGFGSVDAAGNLNNHPAIRSAVLEKNPIQQIYLENLARIAKSDDPQEFVRLIQDLKMANEFTQEFPTGARRAVMGLGLGALSGALSGGADAESIAIFAGLGSVMGGAADRYGVATAKALLNVYVDMTYRIPTFSRWEAALASRNIPLAIQKTILQGFAKQVQLGPDEPVSVDPGRRAELYDEIKASPMDSVTKAQAMDMIAKNGQVPGWVVKKLMLNEEAPRAVIMPKNRAEILNADRPEGVRK